VEKLEDGFKILGIGCDDISFQSPNLLGDHQIINAATAIVACKQLGGFKIDERHIKQGLISAVWPGRIEKIADRLWVDGAHNQGGAIALSLWMSENLTGPRSLILGMTKNRDVEAFLAPFKGVVAHVFCVRVQSEPSSYSAEKLAELASASGIETTICDSLDEAVKLAKPRGGDTVVTGSLFLVGDLCGLICNRAK